MKRSIGLLVALVALVAMGIGTPASAEPTLVGFDAIGDWGVNVDPTLGGLGDAIGSDLIGAAVEETEGDTINFIIQLNALPESGGIPEGVRYIWWMTINGQPVSLDGKHLNYSRGACDPTAGTCPPPRDPGPQPFMVRGNCTSTPAALVCQELGFVRGIFDTASDTITIPVPLSVLGLSGCVEFGSYFQTNTFPNANIIAIPSAFVSQGNMPKDELVLYDEIQETPITVC